MRLLFSLLPKLAEVLSENIGRRLSLLVKFWYFAITRKLLFKGKRLDFVFHLSGKLMPLSLWDNSDLAALIEIFVEKEYDLTLTNPKHIIDLGAHTGNTSIFFSILYPKATIYAVEASPTTYEKLVENVKKYTNIVPVFGAVTDKDGTLTFYESRSSLGSSTKQRHSDDIAINVPCFTLNSLLNKFHIEKVDFIKIDIEGSEEYLFSTSSPESLSDSYIVEVHLDLMSLSENDFLNHFKKMLLVKSRIINVRRKLFSFQKY